MRVALVRTTLHTGSGIVVHMMELARRLSRMGVEVSILTREVEGELDFPSIHPQRFFFSGVPFLRHLGFAFRAGLSAQNFDLIHTQYHPGIFAGNISHTLMGKPHIFTFHGFTPMGLWRNPRQRIKMTDHKIGTAIALRLGVDQIIAVSKYLRRELLEFYRFDPGKVEVIYNGVDAERFRPGIDGVRIREKYDVESSPLILFLGRLAPHKGSQYLVAAAPHILKEVPDAKFIVAGSGRFDAPPLRLLMKSLNVDRSFILTGYVADDDVPYMYAACDIFCYPSLWEGFGLTPAEAQASGKPVVAFNVCAIPEVVENHETGILVPARDHVKLAQAIIDLLLDRRRREEMGRKGRQRVMKLFSWDNVAKETLRLYEKVLKTPSRRRQKA